MTSRRRLSLFLFLSCGILSHSVRHRNLSKLHRSWSDQWLLRPTKKCPCPDARHCQTISGPPIRINGEVYAFANDQISTKFLNWTYLSTVAWASQDALMCEAHAQGSRAVVAAPSIDLKRMAQNNTLVTEWVEDALDLVVGTFRDGIVFDFEGPLNRNSPEMTAYTLLVRETTRALHEVNPSFQIVVCVAWSPDGIDGRYYDYKALADVSDALYVMDYDTASQVFGTCVATANAPLQGMIHGLESYLQLGVPASKLILGVPWYGYKYPCLNETLADDRYCPIPLVPFRGVPCSDAAGKQVSLLNIVAQSQTWERDPNMGAVFFNTVEKDQVFQYWFDDKISLETKFATAKSMNLGGVGPYCLGNLDPQQNPQTAPHFSEEIWSAFDSFFVTDHQTYYDSR